MKYVLFRPEGVFLDATLSIIGDPEQVSLTVGYLHGYGVGLHLITKLQSGDCRSALSLVFPLSFFRTTGSATSMTADRIRWVAETYEKEPDCRALLVVSTDWEDIREARRAGAMCLIATSASLRAGTAGASAL